MAEVLLSSDESSSDAELSTHLQEECGFSLHQATETVKFAERYRCEIFLTGHGPLDCGHASLAYNPHTGEFEPSKKPDTFDSLTRELETWCRVHGVPYQSADELLATYLDEFRTEGAGLRIEERTWLEEYSKRWEAMKKAAEAPAEGQFDIVLTGQGGELDRSRITVPTEQFDSDEFFNLAAHEAIEKWILSPGDTIRIDRVEP